MLIWSQIGSELSKTCHAYAIRITNCEYIVSPPFPHQAIMIPQTYIIIPMQEMKIQKDKKFKGQQDTAIPRAMMIQQCGGRIAFDEALENEEVFPVENNGRTYYAYRTFTIGSRQDITDKKTLTTDVVVSRLEAAKVASILDSVDWNFASVKTIGNKKKISETASIKINEAVISIEKQIKLAKKTANQLHDDGSSGAKKHLADLKGDHDVQKNNSKAGNKNPKQPRPQTTYGM